MRGSPGGSANRVLALVALAIFIPAAQSQEVWPTTRFKAFVGDPYMGDMTGVGQNVLLMEDENFFGISDESVQQIERAFKDAADWYKGQGFPAPDLHPIINTEDGLAYQVYVTNTSTAGLYYPRCGNDPTRTKIMLVSSTDSFDSQGRLTELGYQTIAHELMHSIVANTPLGRSDPDCKIQGWISEGIADAISFDIAEKLKWESRYTLGMTSPEVSKRYGYRPYLESLPQNGEVPIPGGGSDDLKATYSTSSFWRYLADSHLEGWKVLLTPDKDGAKGLLDRPLAGAGWRNEVDWLDRGLRDKFSHDLGEMYAMFVNNLALRPAPMASYQGKPAEENLDHWRKILFDGCKKVDLPNEGSQAVTLHIKHLASGCLLVKPTAQIGLVQVSFIASSNDKRLLEDIVVGRAGTTLVRRAAISDTPQAPLPYTASWSDFPQDGTQWTMYLFSNFAKKPSETNIRQLDFTAVLPGNTNSARATTPMPPRVAPPPQLPSYDRHAKRLSEQKSATTKMVEAQMQLDKESLNANVSSATQISRRPDQPACPEPFRTDACGPQTTISLGLAPGTYIQPGQTNTSGGMAGQAFSGFQAMAQTSLWDAEPRVKALAEATDAIDGSQVSIAMPLIDYGFTGTIDNADIIVDMAGDKFYRAIGTPDENGLAPLVGRVTIKEYSPAVLIGSFSAQLGELETSASGRPVLRSHGTVSGSFTVAAPYQADERSQIILDSTEEMAEDIANAMGLPADMIYSMKQDGSLVNGAPPVPASPGASAGTVLQTGCSCECNMRESADDLCELFCEEEFEACENP